MPGKKRHFKIFACDLETTVYSGQEYTEAWSSALVELNTEDVIIHHSIDETWAYLKSLKTNCRLYYHNLKFDGEFWLYFIMTKTNLQPAIRHLSDHDYDIEWITRTNEMPNNSYTYMISDLGQWYTITIKSNNYIYEFRDSLKLMPFSLAAISKSFKTKHQKLTMKYEGFRYAGCPISEAERAYISNDVLVLKEALEFMFSQGHDKITIGSCCMSEFRQGFFRSDFNNLFPNLYDYEIDPAIYGKPNAGEYIRRSYHGGWCYLVPEKANKTFKHGLTADVNSLYPSQMHSDGGRFYPVGFPHFWEGNYIPEEADRIDRYFFIRFRCRFRIKDGFLPFVQIKGSWFYRGNEMLTSSDITIIPGKRYGEYKSFSGEIRKAEVILTMTCTDFKLFLEHYDVYDLEILDGCWFYAEKGIFDNYINKYRDIKIKSTGAMRTLAKLFLNNLYGKMAASTDSSFKYAYMKDDQSLGYVAVRENKKRPGYIACGSAITSYARDFTIRAAQRNYHGSDRPGFIYADTDSIHCDLSPDELISIPTDDVLFNHWKLESLWDEARFVRQKTYIEHITHEDLQPVDPYYSIRCAGMPERSKDIFLAGMKSISAFKTGLKVGGKLMPKKIPGGIILVNTIYEMRKQK